jgi:hypothetical protein
MAKYVYVYTGGGMAATEEEQNAAMAAWGAWMGGLGGALLDMGNPFGASAGVKSDGSNGATGSALTGYSIVEASSLDDAVAKSRGCPVFASGGAVDVYEAIEVSM